VVCFEGQGVYMSKNGMATFIFLAMGQIGSDGKQRDGGTDFYPKATGNFAFLANTIAVWKDEIMSYQRFIIDTPVVH
jgi:hypothetical protein